MTVRHRQRKGSKSGFFLYAREKAFSKPPAFSAKTARRFPAHGPITLHTPPAFPASFPPAQPRCPPFSRQKGAFLPPAPAVPAFWPARTPRFAPGAARFLPGARPDGDPACPGFARDPGARAHPPGTPEAPAFAAFLPARARFCPPCAARTPEGSPPAAETTPPCAASPPVAAARRPKVSPPRHSLGAGNPDCRGRLSRFAVEKCAPLGADQIPGHDG